MQEVFEYITNNPIRSKIWCFSCPDLIFYHSHHKNHCGAINLLADNQQWIIQSTFFSDSERTIPDRGQAGQIFGSKSRKFWIVCRFLQMALCLAWQLMEGMGPRNAVKTGTWEENIKICWFGPECCSINVHNKQLLVQTSWLLSTWLPWEVPNWISEQL